MTRSEAQLAAFTRLGLATVIRLAQALRPD